MGNDWDMFDDNIEAYFERDYSVKYLGVGEIINKGHLEIETNSFALNGQTPYGAKATFYMMPI